MLSPSGGSSGFSLIEVLLALALTLCLAVAIAPLMTSLQSVGVEQTDRSIQALQARVAFARFERDLRLAGGGDCPFPTSGALLEAMPSQVVFVVPTPVESAPILVEWEIAGSRLMRRSGPCPRTHPGLFVPGLFSDNKTMLEGVGAGSGFSYRIGSRVLEPPLTAQERAVVDTIALDLRVAPSSLGKLQPLATVGRVGR
ncbi:MAG: prepilin-type N-terminal cleavage/methylation domain-containing protein [Thermoleophilia bacterium]